MQRVTGLFGAGMESISHRLVSRVLSPLMACCLIAAAASAAGITVGDGSTVDLDGPVDTVGLTWDDGAEVTVRGSHTYNISEFANSRGGEVGIYGSPAINAPEFKFAKYIKPGESFEMNIYGSPTIACLESTFQVSGRGGLTKLRMDGGSLNAKDNFRFADGKGNPDGSRTAELTISGGTIQAAWMWFLGDDGGNMVGTMNGGQLKSTGEIRFGTAAHDDALWFQYTMNAGRISAGGDFLIGTDRATLKPGMKSELVINGGTLTADKLRFGTKSGRIAINKGLIQVTSQTPADLARLIKDGKIVVPQGATPKFRSSGGVTSMAVKQPLP